MGIHWECKFLSVFLGKHFPLSHGSSRVDCWSIPRADLEGYVRFLTFTCPMSPTSTERLYIFERSCTVSFLHPILCICSKPTKGHPTLSSHSHSASFFILFGIPAISTVLVKQMRGIRHSRSCSPKNWARIWTKIYRMKTPAQDPPKLSGCPQGVGNWP